MSTLGTPDGHARESPPVAGRGGSMPMKHDSGAVLAHIEGLTVTQGQGVGEKIELLPWERRFLRGVLRTDGDAALTLARGNGKTTLAAALAHAALDGPLVQPRAEVVASSFGQARIDFEHVLGFLSADGPLNRRRWRVQDSAQSASIEDRETGARVGCIASDPRRAHGLAPLIVIADEPAQWPANTSERMLAALRTSMGKIPGSRLIALGTRSENPEH